MAAVPIPGNAKSTLEQRWESLICDRKDQVPNTIQEIDEWIARITSCMKVVADARDQIGRDPSEHIISPSFGLIMGGQLMNALGNNNDCLIHSFLSCVSRSFRKFSDEIRSTLASFFRRFVLPAIPGIDPNVRDRLRSYRFLTGGEIEFLSIHYQIPIINLQDSDHEIERSMEIFPPLNHPFWEGKMDSYTGPFYLIHGDNTHFTPIAYGGVYPMRLHFGGVKRIAETITAEHAAVFEAAAEDNAKLDVVKQDFKYRIQPIMDSITKEIKDSKNNNKQTKSIKMSSMLEILTPLTEEYIDDIIQQKLVREDLLEKVRATIRTTLVDELGQHVVSNTPNSSSEIIKKLEDFAGQYGLSNDDAVAQAIKASLPISTNTVANSTTAVPANVKQVVTPSIKPVKVDVLRRINNITASIGNSSTQYSAIVYKPVTTAVTGGKRKTKKVKYVKRRKTKKSSY